MSGWHRHNSIVTAGRVINVNTFTFDSNKKFQLSFCNREIYKPAESLFHIFFILVRNIFRCHDEGFFDYERLQPTFLPITSTLLDRHIRLDF